MDIKATIAAMTLEEKAGLLSGLDFWHTKPVPRLGVDPAPLWQPARRGGSRTHLCDRGRAPNGG